MPPIPTWFQGRDAVAIVPRRTGRWRTRSGWRMLPIRASGQIAFGAYIRRADRDVYAAHVIEVLTLRGDRISEIVSFMSPESFRAFGLPQELDA